MFQHRIYLHEIRMLKILLIPPIVISIISNYTYVWCLKSYSVVTIILCSSISVIMQMETNFFTLINILYIILHKTKKPVKQQGQNIGIQIFYF